MQKPKVSDDDFTITNTIGSGSFSTVSRAIDKNGRVFALKKLFWNNSPDRIVKEIRWIQQLDHPNIVKLYASYRNQDQATLVMNFVEHTNFRQLLPKMNGVLLSQYMKGLLQALEHMHSKGIIHRDVKPANFLFDPATGNGCLIDFGLCDSDMHIKKPVPKATFSPETFDNDYDLNYPQNCQGRPKLSANRAGTRGFRAPEVLFSDFNQTTLIDIWSAGVILLTILSQRYPFFKSPDDLTSICEISTIVGTKKLHEAAHECGRKLRFPMEQPGIPFPELVRKLNPYYDEMEVDECVFDLLSKMMEPRPSMRITATDALKHKFITGK